MKPTLFEFAGGEEALLALARAHHARCLADPELNHPFSHPDQHPRHVERLAAYWGEVLGGPPAYSGACEGEQTALLEMHAHNGPMNAYMRWAVADVLLYAPVDAVVPAGAPIPRWGWDGLEPGT